MSSLLGPQIPVEIQGISILVVAFEESAPLAFDVNTVEEGIIKMVPDLSDKQKELWLTQRPFSNFDDFKTRCGLDEKVLKHFSS
jgi:hypothetical protein